MKLEVTPAEVLLVCGDGCAPDEMIAALRDRVAELEAKLARINDMAVSMRDGIGTGPHVSGLRTLAQNIVEASR